MKLLNWKPVRTDAGLRGFAFVEYHGLILRDFAVYNKAGQPHGHFPGRTLWNGEDAKVDENGKILFSPIIEWTSRNKYFEFINEIVYVIEQQHPGATAP